MVEILRKFPSVNIIVRKNDDTSILNLSYDAIIISPGPGLPQESGLLSRALSMFRAKVPILGICLGLQAIVEEYGGKLKQLPKVFHGIRDSIYILGESPIFEDLPDQFFAGRYHSWVADKINLPQNIEIIAEDSEGEIMGIQILPDNCYAVQFHPESYMTDLGFYIMQNFIALAQKEKTMAI